MTPKKDDFLKKVEDSIDKNNSVQKERYLHIKNQILERVKETKSRRRTFSGSSIASQSSRGSRSSSLKRGNTDGQTGKSPTRLKTGIPSIKQ